MRVEVSRGGEGGLLHRLAIDDPAGDHPVGGLGRAGGTNSTSTPLVEPFGLESHGTSPMDPVAQRNQCVEHYR